MRGSDRFDVVVGIPTFNESDSISFVATNADRGLRMLPPNLRSVILNVDSHSTDGTREVFKNTELESRAFTRTCSRSIRGKGANVFDILEASIEWGASYIILLDGDVLSGEPDWIPLLLRPLVAKEADFCSPIYARNRYEGNTTNHFCLPVLLAWLGRTLSQPIGGECSLTSTFRDFVLAQDKCASVDRYGIDIHLSCHALAGGFDILEVDLGRKAHKASFNHIGKMFPEVAESLFGVMRSYPPDHTIDSSEPVMPLVGRIDQFSKPPSKKSAARLRLFAREQLSRLDEERLKPYTLNDTREKTMQASSPSEITSLWADILAQVVSKFRKGTIDVSGPRELAAILTPYFLLRVASHCAATRISDPPSLIEENIHAQLREVAVRCRQYMNEVGGGTSCNK